MRAPLALAAVAALALAACGPRLEQKPDQAEATRVVWVTTYGVTDKTPPAIEWVDAGSLDCGNGNGWESADAGSGGTPLCVAGLFYSQDWLAYVAWPAGEETFSPTAFAHEMCHAFWYLSTNGASADPSHTGPCFQPGGYVQQANAALEAEGL